MTKKSESDKKEKRIDKAFKSQEEEFNFRQPEIKEYRDKAQEILKKDLPTRFKKTISKDVESIEITKERLDNRQTAYGTPHIFIELREIERGKNKGKLEYVARNTKTKKIEERIFKKEALTKKEHEKILRDRIKDKGFKYEAFYIPEDSEPLKRGDPRKDITISYNTFFRFGIMIYRLKGGKKYEVIYRANDSRVIDRYVSFQRIIALVKDDVIRHTGITLEEWIFLSKTENNLFLEGGLSYKRKKGIHDPNKRFIFKTEYEQTVDFESI